jgi:hypothetical protein
MSQMPNFPHFETRVSKGGHYLNYDHHMMQCKNCKSITTVIIREGG